MQEAAPRQMTPIPPPKASLDFISVRGRRMQFPPDQLILMCSPAERPPPRPAPPTHTHTFPTVISGAAVVVKPNSAAQRV